MKACRPSSPRWPRCQPHEGRLLLSFGKELLAFRKGNHLSQQGLGRRLGCSGRLICYLEHGQVPPSKHICLSIREHFGNYFDSVACFRYFASRHERIEKG